MTGMHVAIVGPLGSGKTTTANACAGLYAGVRLSFAFPLKLFAKALTQRDHGRDPGRADFQEIGVSFRPYSLWTQMMEYNLQGRDFQNVFIDDLRFPDEYEILREHGFKVVKLNLSPLEVGRRQEIRDGQAATAKTMSHESEKHWPAMDADLEITDPTIGPLEIARLVGDELYG